MILVTLSLPHHALLNTMPLLLSSFLLCVLYPHPDVMVLHRAEKKLSPRALTGLLTATQPPVWEGARYGEGRPLESRGGKTYTTKTCVCESLWLTPLTQLLAPSTCHHDNP